MLAVAAGVMAAKFAPADYADTLTAAAAMGCPQLCGFALSAAEIEPPVRPHDAVNKSKATASARTAPAGVAAANETVLAQVATPSAATPEEPEESVPSEPVRQNTAAEPITTRPVADKFDFIGPALLEMLADDGNEADRRQFAELPVSELQAVAPANVREIKSAESDAAAVRPDIATAASKQTSKAGSAAMVAGWRLIRTIKARQVSEQSALGQVTIPVIPNQKPHAPESGAAQLETKSAASKKSRRSSKRSYSASVSKKSRPPAVKILEDQSWQSRVLFREY